MVGEHRSRMVFLVITVLACLVIVAFASYTTAERVHKNNSQITTNKELSCSTYDTLRTLIEKTPSLSRSVYYELGFDDEQIDDIEKERDFSRTTQLEILGPRPKECPATK